MAISERNPSTFVPLASSTLKSFVFKAKRSASSRPALRSTRALLLMFPATSKPGRSCFNSLENTPSTEANREASSRFITVAVLNGSFSSSSVSRRLTLTSASCDRASGSIRSFSLRRNSRHAVSSPLKANEPCWVDSFPPAPGRPLIPANRSPPSIFAVSPFLVATTRRSGLVCSPVTVIVPFADGSVAEILSSFTPNSSLSNSDRAALALRSGFLSATNGFSDTAAARSHTAVTTPSAFKPDGTNPTTSGMALFRSIRAVPVVAARWGDAPERAAAAFNCRKSPADSDAAARWMVGRPPFPVGRRRLVAVKDAESGSGPKRLPE